MVSCTYRGHQNEAVGTGGRRALCDAPRLVPSPSDLISLLKCHPLGKTVIPCCPSADWCPLEELTENTDSWAMTSREFDSVSVEGGLRIHNLRALPSEFKMATSLRNLWVKALKRHQKY